MDSQLSQAKTLDQLKMIAMEAHQQIDREFREAKAKLEYKPLEIRQHVGHVSPQSTAYALTQEAKQGWRVSFTKDGVIMLEREKL